MTVRTRILTCRLLDMMQQETKHQDDKIVKAEDKRPDDERSEK